MVALPCRPGKITGRMNTPESTDPEIIRDIIKKKPYLSHLAALDPDEGPLNVARSKHGEPIFSISPENGRTRTLSSAYDPVREAERMIPADVERWKGREIILILGPGNPLLLRTILPHLRENQICITVDALEQTGSLLLYRMPSAIPYLQRPGCHLFCGPSMEVYLRTYLEAIPSPRISGLRVISNSASRNLAPRFYDEIENTVRKSIQSRISDILTRQEFQRTWLRNILMNSRYFPPRTNSRDPLQNIDTNTVEGILSGRPGLLVSAGPSLKDSLNWMRRIQNRAFILSTDTAYKVLMRNGIIPHGVITLDAQSHSLFHFLGENVFNEQVPLFADTVCHPSLIRLGGFQQVLFSITARYNTDAAGQIQREITPGSEFIEEIYGNPGELQSGGSVATNAFDLLRKMGAARILLVGQDLAYTGRKIHSTGTHHNERWLTKLNRVTTLENINEGVIAKRQTFYVPALNGGEVLTDYVLDLYRHWFEQSIPESDVEVINLSHAGAVIEGASRPDNVEEFVESLTEYDDMYRLIPDIKNTAKLYKHEKLIAIYEDLKRAVELSISHEELFTKHPSLRILERKGELYVERYAEKIGSDEAAKIKTLKISEEINSLLRRLKI